MTTIAEKMKSYSITNNTLNTADLLAALTNEATGAEIMNALPLPDIYYLSEMDYMDLLKIPGVGEKMASRIFAAVELGKRIAESQSKQYMRDCCDLENVANYLMNKMRYYTQETVIALYLNSKNRLIAEKTVNVGSNTQSILDIKSILKYAIQYNSVALIIAHNHPSGDPSPSTEDIHVTRKLDDACKAIDVTLHDHIIVGDNCFVSFCEKGYI